MVDQMALNHMMEVRFLLKAHCAYRSMVDQVAFNHMTMVRFHVGAHCEYGEMVDTLVLETSPFGGGGSSPPTRTLAVM